MLNEYIEYFEYTDKEYLQQLNGNKNKKHRLDGNELLNRDASGLTRAEEVICKHFLEMYDNDYAIAEKAVKAWLGYVGKEEAENEPVIREICEIQGYFNPDLIGKDGYYRQNSNIKDEIYDKFLKTYEDKKKSFSRKKSNKKDHNENFEVNDVNAAGFEKLYYKLKGSKLHKRVLVCNCDIFEKYDFYCEENTIRKGKNKKENKDHILKIIATYLLRRVVDNALGVHIRVIDICNWSVLSKNIGKKIYRYSFNQDRTPLLVRTNDDNNTTIIKVNDGIIAHFRLVEYEDINTEVKQGDIVYIDQGKDYLEKVEIQEEDDIMRVLQEANKERVIIGSE